MDKPYSAEELANGIAEIINCALKQLEEQTVIETAHIWIFSFQFQAFGVACKI